MTLPFKFRFGPGTLVAAAFIGPGTVTACSLAGANFGFALLWALVFATCATMILQEMSARLGVVGRVGLGEAIMSGTQNRGLRLAAAGIILSAILIGNAAYEAGNISGAVIGLQISVVSASLPGWAGPILIGSIAGALLAFGGYKLVERVLIGLVLLMSLAFLVAVLIVRPDPVAMFRGLIPSIPDGATLTAVALIGTTIVPYNLFLHAASAREKWEMSDDLSEARGDTITSIGLGGLISIFILVTAATAMLSNSSEITGVGALMVPLESAIGPAGRYILAIGLFAAGLTSAMTAPLAAGYAVSEIVKPSTEALRQRWLRVTALMVLVIGVVFASTPLAPTDLIVFAQAANGLLLPIVGIFLLRAMNDRELLGEHANTPLQNGLGALVVGITILLGARLILRTIGLWP